MSNMNRPCLFKGNYNDPEILQSIFTFDEEISTPTPCSLTPIIPSFPKKVVNYSCTGTRSLIGSPISKRSSNERKIAVGIKRNLNKAVESLKNPSPVLNSTTKQQVD